MLVDLGSSSSEEEGENEKGQTAQHFTDSSATNRTASMAEHAAGSIGSLLQEGRDGGNVKPEPRVWSEPMAKSEPRVEQQVASAAQAGLSSGLHMDVADRQRMQQPRGEGQVTAAAANAPMHLGVKSEAMEAAAGSCQPAQGNSNQHFLNESSARLASGMPKPCMPPENSAAVHGNGMAWQMMACNRPSSAAQLPLNTPAMQQAPDERHVYPSSQASQRMKEEPQLSEKNVGNIKNNPNKPFPSANAAPSRPPLPEANSSHPHSNTPQPRSVPPAPSRWRQFWQAGDYEVVAATRATKTVGMDVARVHPKFLHSNATSHKWALGAIAELLDNAMDEVGNGASFVRVDVESNPRDQQPMLIVQDDGGGMSPDRIRAAMSLGFSQKTKSGNTIGQYGNGFKTSTMRLGADVIVFSRAATNTQSIGLLSYTFLRETGQEDIIVPIVDYHHSLHPSASAPAASSPLPLPLLRSTAADWQENLDTLVTWGPFGSEDELRGQLLLVGPRGTRVVIFNLWLLEGGTPELDFLSDPHDIRIHGKQQEQAKAAQWIQSLNTWNYFTHSYSLRSYASMLYLRRPMGFKIFIRGREVEAAQMEDDLMLVETTNYAPMNAGGVAEVTMGFVRNAAEHVDVQGFNVYHKNRLIKPFWKVWSSTSSVGRGVIGYLEADFIEPAHDKQDFERTPVLQRLQNRLLSMMKQYWRMNAYHVGYRGASIFVPPSISEAIGPSRPPPPLPPPPTTAATAPLPPPPIAAADLIPLSTLQAQRGRVVHKRQKTATQRNDPTWWPPSSSGSASTNQRSPLAGESQQEGLPIASFELLTEQVVDVTWLTSLEEERDMLLARWKHLEAEKARLNEMEVEVNVLQKQLDEMGQTEEEEKRKHEELRARHLSKLKNLKAQLQAYNGSATA